MTATPKIHASTSAEVLYLALELGETEWKLAFTVGVGQKPRLRSMPARDLPRLQAEIAKAKERFHLAAEVAVRSCYEAGRDGFWLHRYLTACGVDNHPAHNEHVAVRVETNLIGLVQRRLGCRAAVSVAFTPIPSHRSDLAALTSSTETRQ